MAKKQYRIEVEATTTNIAALKAANIDFTLCEVNEGNEGPAKFHHRPNYKSKEVILNPVEEMDTTEYTEQQLAEHYASLEKKLTCSNLIEKVVRL